MVAAVHILPTVLLNEVAYVLTYENPIHLYPNRRADEESKTPHMRSLLEDLPLQYSIFHQNEVLYFQPHHPNHDHDIDFYITIYSSLPPYRGTSLYAQCNRYGRRQSQSFF